MTTLPTKEKPGKYRPDFVHGLIHLTKGRECKPKHTEAGFKRNEEAPTIVSAFDVLKEIISDGIIYGSTTDSGCIKGENPAVCLSEMPLPSLRYLAGVTGSKYDLYGLTFSKRAIFAVEGRPVIYLPNTDISWVPAEEKWRIVRFKLCTDFTHDKCEDADCRVNIDHSFEREWRVKGNINLSDVRGFLIIVKTMSESIEIHNMIEGNKLLESKLRGVLPMDALFKHM